MNAVKSNLNGVFPRLCGGEIGGGTACFFNDNVGGVSFCVNCI